MAEFYIVDALLEAFDVDVFSIVLKNEFHFSLHSCERIGIKTSYFF
jgi:hypothetical protein